MVLSDPLHWLEQVGVEGQLVVQVDLDALEESFILRLLTQQCLRVGAVLTIHRVHLKLPRLKGRERWEGRGGEINLALSVRVNKHL